MDQDGLQPPIATTSRPQPPIATTSRRQPPIDPALRIMLFVILFSLFLFFFFFLFPLLSHIKSIIVLFASLSGFLPERNDVSSIQYDQVQDNGDFRQKPLPENHDNLARSFSDDLQTVNNHSRRMEKRKENIYQSEPGHWGEVYSGVSENIVQQRQLPKPPPVSVKLRKRQTSRSVNNGYPPPPETSGNRNELDRETNKEMAPTLSLDDQRKRNQKNRQKSRHTHPTPSPPPPSSSRFQKMFRKGRKPKGIHTVPATAPPTPPPPPPPWSIFNTLFKSGGKSKRFSSSLTNNSFPKTVTRFNSSSSASASSSQFTVQPPSPPLQPLEPLRRRPASTHKPPLPTNASNYYHDHDDLLSSISQSQWNPIPPPPPPFKLPAMIFELRDHYIRQRSVHSSDFSSPDRDVIDGGDPFGPTPISSRSPDINAMADRFISRLKHKWRTQKINSQAQAQAQTKTI